MLSEGLSDQMELNKTQKQTNLSNILGMDSKDWSQNPFHRQNVSDEPIVCVCVVCVCGVCVCVCVCVLCVCVCVHVYVVYEDTNLYNDMGMT